jgi:hypothetical protein
MASKKRQQTFLKRQREHEVQERRTLKHERKRAAAAARAAEAAGETPDAPAEPSELE